MRERSKPLKHLRFSGKTIQRIDARALNCATFYFTDGSHIRIEVECAGNGLYGIFGVRNPKE